MKKKCACALNWTEFFRNETWISFFSGSTSTCLLYAHHIHRLDSVHFYTILEKKYRRWWWKKYRNSSSCCCWWKTLESFLFFITQYRNESEKNECFICWGERGICCCFCCCCSAIIIITTIIIIIIWF